MYSTTLLRFGILEAVEDEANKSKMHCFSGPRAFPLQELRIKVQKRKMEMLFAYYALSGICESPYKDFRIFPWLMNLLAELHASKT